MSRKRKSRGSSRSAKPADPEPSGSARESSSGRPDKLAISVAVLGLGVLVYVVFGVPKPPAPRSRGASTATSDVESWQNAMVQNVTYSPERDYSVGPDNAPVTIVEFSDFECPYCRDGSADLKRVFDRYPDKIRIVFRNYPLDTSCNRYLERPVHLYACRAATMARCAGAEGRFWEMHDAIFGIPQMSLGALDELPANLGLSAEAFSACMTDDAPMGNIQADIEEGKQLGVEGTPTIFVNGRKAPSSQAESLFSIVDRVLAEDS